MGSFKRPNFAAASAASYPSSRPQATRPRAGSSRCHLVLVPERRRRAQLVPERRRVPSSSPRARPRVPERLLVPARCPRARPLVHDRRRLLVLGDDPRRPRAPPRPLGVASPPTRPPSSRMDEGRRAEPIRCPTAYYELVTDEEGDEEEAEYETPSPPFPPAAKRQHSEGPVDSDYNPNDEILPQRSNRKRVFVEEAAALVPTEEGASPASSSQQKVRKTGKRKQNKLSKGIHRVDAVCDDGSPIEPQGILAKWRNDCGCFVREKGKIAWDNWKDVDPDEKEKLWKLVAAKFIFPQDLLEAGKAATLKTMSKCLRTFRYKLDKDYIKTGKTPFRDFGFLSSDDWNAFVAQRTSEEFHAVSNIYSALNKKNQLHHNLGPGGYKAKIPIWRNKEREDSEAGKEDEYGDCSIRTRNWLFARLKKLDDGKLVPKNSQVSEVVQRAKEFAMAHKAKNVKGKKIPDEQLTFALGTKEHSGRTRGVSSMARIKEGSTQDDNTDDNTCVDQLFTEFQMNMFRFMQENPLLSQPMSVPEVHLSPSSVGSTPADTSVRYPVDDMKEDTPCSLLVTMSRKGKTRQFKVAEGAVFVGRTLHNSQIPQECAKVFVSRIVDDNFLKEELDYPNEEEGIETFEQAINNFVAWHKRDIVIHTRYLVQTVESPVRAAPDIPIK